MEHRLSITVGFAGTAAVILSAFAMARADGDGREKRRAACSEFSREIQPILAEHCLKCHGATTQKADLDLRSPAKMEKGGVNGPAIEQGHRARACCMSRSRNASCRPGKRPS